MGDVKFGQHDSLVKMGVMTQSPWVSNWWSRVRRACCIAFDFSGSADAWTISRAL
jgi:hypothetical protein